MVCPYIGVIPPGLLGNVVLVVSNAVDVARPTIHASVRLRVVADDNLVDDGLDHATGTDLGFDVLNAWIDTASSADGVPARRILYLLFAEPKRRVRAIPLLINIPFSVRPIAISHSQSKHMDCQS